MTIYVKCLPKEKLKGAARYTTSASPPDGGVAGGVLECDPGQLPITGGASWSETFENEQKEDAFRGILSSSVPAEIGWYADGADNWITTAAVPLVLLDGPLHRRGQAQESIL